MKFSTIFQICFVVATLVYIAHETPNAIEVEQNMRQQQSELAWRMYEQGY